MQKLDIIKATRPKLILNRETLKTLGQRHLTASEPTEPPGCLLPTYTC